MRQITCHSCGKSNSMTSSGERPNFCTHCGQSMSLARSAPRQTPQQSSRYDEDDDEDFTPRSRIDLSRVKMEIESLDIDQSAQKFSWDQVVQQAKNGMRGSNVGRAPDATNIAQMLKNANSMTPREIGGE